MATYVVTNSNASGAGSLFSAIQAAEASAGTDTITFSGVSVLRPAAMFTLTTSIVFDGDLNNDGIADVTISGDVDADGKGNHGLFRLDPTANATFDGLVLRDGAMTAFANTPVGGAILNFGKATVVNSQFVNNTGTSADGQPGGADGADGSAGGSAAGAIYNAGTLSIKDSQFSANSADAGDGGDGVAGGSGNPTGGDGGSGGNAGTAAGAVLNAAGATMTLTAVEFGSGMASGGAGGNGGSGGTGTVSGGDGGDAGDGGLATRVFLNLGKASGSFVVTGGGSVGIASPGTPGKGGDGVLGAGGADGAPGRGSFAAPGFGMTAGSKGDDVFAGLGGNEFVIGFEGNDRLTGAGGDDILDGHVGNDVLDGGSGNDDMRGGEGDDLLKVSAGDDSYSGSTGTDTLDLSTLTGPVTIDLGLFDSQFFLGGSVNLGGDIENVIGTAGGDTLTGTFAANRIDGGDGKDTMSGGAGNDIYVVDQAGDVIVESAGNGSADRVAARGSYALAADDHIELLTTISSGGTAAIDLTGNALKQEITGNAGVNTLKDGGGAGDVLRGLGGSDTYLVYGAATKIVEGAAQGSADRVAAGVDFVLGAGVHVERLTTTSAAGTAAIDLTGNALKQEITGNAGANVLHDGGPGAADRLIGLGGNDTYRIFNSGDVVVEGSGQGTADRVVAAVDYRLAAGVRVEIMTTNGAAGTAATDLTGNEFAQEITGNSGGNRLEGRGGADTLRGLGGDDTFVFATKLGGGNVDTVTDFDVADDRFLLSDAIFAALSPGALAASAFRANATGLAADASDRIVYETDTGRLFYDADGTGSAGRVHFATITAGLALTSADFSVA